MQKTKEWLVLNAVYAWLYHYGDQADSVVMKHQYEELQKELENEQSKNTSVKNGDVRRKDKGRKKPQALRSAKQRAKMLKLKLLLSQSRAKDDANT